MASSSPWDTYSQHAGLQSSLESYSHPFTSSEMRGLAGSSSAGMGGLPGEGMLGYPKSGDLTAAGLNLTSPYASYAQSYPGMSDLSFPSSSLRPSSTAHSSGSAPDNMPASSPHGQYSSTPTSENQSSSPTFPISTSMYTPSTATSSISSSPYAQAFGGSNSSADAAAAAAAAAARGPFSSFAQSYGYPMYGYNHMAGFPPSSSIEGVNRYMGGISSSPLMQPSAMGIYSNSQSGQMAFPYHSAMGWGSPIPGFPLKEGSDLMAQDELERYRYRQLSNPYFSGLPTGGSPVRNFPPHPLQQSMIRTPPFLDDRAHSPPPKKQKKSTEDSERPPTPSPRDPSAFHSNRGIYLFTSDAEPGSTKFFSDRYVLCEKELCKKLSRVSLPGKIQYVYNPLEYAFESHLNFVRRFCTGEKYILFVGMNPGPFGMSQNGVPFGECAVVKEWMHIDGEVFKPVLEHPKRRVVGLECSRSEVTGGRFWQLFRTLCHTPEHFFRTSFVHSLCPFAFLTDTGKNVTPPQLVSSVLDQINALCNETLVEVVRLLKSKYVICVGKYALAQAQKALSGDEFSGVVLECLMHPSPINPATNKGWTDIAMKQLTEMGIIDVIRYGRIPYQASGQSQSSHSSSSLSLNQHSQSHHPYSNKKSPGHYDFQSPSGQSYQQTAQGSTSHQSPLHPALLNQSPAHGSSRSQSSPAHASFHSQSSPGHSSCSQSPALQPGAPNQSPSLVAGSSCSVVQAGPGGSSADNHHGTSEPPHSEAAGFKNPSVSEPPPTATNLTTDMSQESKIVPHLDTNGIPPFSSPPDDLDNSLENSHSDSGSPGTDMSKPDSPGIPYHSGNQPMNLPDPHLSAPSSRMSDASVRVSNGIQMTAADQVQLNMGSGHGHMGMGLNLSASPGLQPSGLAEQHMGLNEQINSPHMRTPDPRMVSHMGPATGRHMQMDMGLHGLGMHSHMGSLNPYGQMDMGQMGGYGSASMAVGNYSANSGMRSSADIPGYGHHMGLYNPDMGMAMPGMPPGRPMGMFNHHMGSVMAAPESLPMHPGMYDNQLGKESPYSSHFLDKPPECS